MPVYFKNENYGFSIEAVNDLSVDKVDNINLLW